MGYEIELIFSLYSSSFCIATKFNPQQQSGTQFVMTQLIQIYSLLKSIEAKCLGFVFFGLEKAYKRWRL